MNALKDASSFPSSALDVVGGFRRSGPVIKDEVRLLQLASALKYVFELQDLNANALPGADKLVLPSHYTCVTNYDAEAFKGDILKILQKTKEAGTTPAFRRRQVNCAIETMLTDKIDGINISDLKVIPDMVRKVLDLAQAKDVETVWPANHCRFMAYGCGGGEEDGGGEEESDESASDDEDKNVRGL